MWGVGPFVLSSKAVLSIKGELGGGRAEDSRRNFAFHPLFCCSMKKKMRRAGWVLRTFVHFEAAIAIPLQRHYSPKKIDT